MDINPETIIMLVLISQEIRLWVKEIREREAAEKPPSPLFSLCLYTNSTNDIIE